MAQNETSLEQEVGRLREEISAIKKRNQNVELDKAWDSRGWNPRIAKDFEKSFSDLRVEIDGIKQRNQNVELDKAWETSITRKLLIAILTYLVISIYMLAIRVDQPFLNAIVPTVGFVLSTITLQYFKKLWTKNQEKRS